MKAYKNLIIVAAAAFMAGGTTALLAADDDKRPEITKAIADLNSAAEHLRNTEKHDLKGHRKQAWDHVQTAITEAREAHNE